MKKLLFIVLALLLGFGVSYAANIPVVVDPSAYPEVWTQEVYNDAGSNLTSGSIVVWDYTDSDMYNIENRKMYVTTTTTVDDIAVAGIVVDPTLYNGEVGTIAIRGPVACKVTGTVTAGLALATSATAGVVGPYSNTGADDGYVGFSIAATTNATLGGGADIGIVFVEPGIAPD
uniref:Uncharacterized protein n=1 Tax=viral metagenome TaxID=1070528 RepID=A0A6M3KJD0_9ZZZZ